MREKRERTAVVLDQQPLWLTALEELLERVGVSVVATASLPEEAVALVEEHRPDLLIAGLDSSDADPKAALACIRRTKEVSPATKSIVLSGSDEPEEIDAAFDAGATVYCVKTAEPDDVASAIRQAFRHSIYLAHNRPPARPAQRQASANGVQPELTKRELEILQLVAEGHSNSQLARMLWVTEQTVKFHLSNVYRKLDVSNRTEASRWAQLHGLLPETQSTVAA
jgi:DNA-binding NarL/FixJ family response regulator